MSKRDLEALLGALRSAASREQLADMLTTLLSKEEVEELAERLVAVREVVRERARVVVPSQGFRSFYLSRPPALGVLRDAAVEGGGWPADPASGRGRGESETKDPEEGVVAGDAAPDSARADIDDTESS